MTPILIAVQGNHVRHLEEPDSRYFEGQETTPMARLIHAISRSRTLGFCSAAGPVLRMSEEYAKESDALFVAIVPGVELFPPPIGFFRGVPVYIDAGSNCVVVDYTGRPQL